MISKQIKDISKNLNKFEVKKSLIKDNYWLFFENITIRTGYKFNILIDGTKISLSKEEKEFLKPLIQKQITY